MVNNKKQKPSNASKIKKRAREFKKYEKVIKAQLEKDFTNAAEGKFELSCLHLRYFGRQCERELLKIDKRRKLRRRQSKEIDLED